MERIKEGIWDIHEGVTSGEKQTASSQDNIMAGTLPKYKYVNNLKQRYLLQQAFERILRENAGKSDFVRTVVTEEQYHADKASEDLRFFGIDANQVQPLPATEAMTAFFAETAGRDPRLLLAIHYIIEGSNNGAMFIAKAVKKAYGLEGTEGTRHLQPYGTAIRDKWKAFGESFNSLDIDEKLMEEMIRTGRQTFHHMNAVGVASYALPETDS